MGETSTRVSTRAVEGFRADDPVARRTEWDTNSWGGANFSTHKLVRVGPGRLEVKASGPGKLFALLFIISGLGVLGVGLLGTVQGSQSGAVVIGLLFVLAGGWMLFYFTVPVVFDKRSGRFSREARSSSPSVRRMARESSAALSDIHALQLLAAFVTDTEGENYYYYELNLVLRDATRLHVVNYSKKSRLRADARALSVFLGRPVWDAIA